MQGMQKLLVRMLPNFSVKKVASSANPIVLVTQSSSLYTLGNSEQGQHGRVLKLLAFLGGRRGLGVLLTPANVKMKANFTAFVAIWGRKLQHGC